MRKGSIERTVLGRRHIVFLGGPRRCVLGGSGTGTWQSDFGISTEYS